MDGTLDGILFNNGHSLAPGFYTYDETGIFKSLGKSFNMNLDMDYDNAIITDYNLDGLPDLLAPSNKGNIFINDGDFDFSIEEVETDIFNRGLYDNFSFSPDMDNDGKPDFQDLVYKSLYLYRNTGNLQHSETMANFNCGYDGDELVFADFNHDGYIDIVTQPDDNFIFLFNKGNWIFEQKGTGYTGKAQHVADVDNDGYPDFINISDNKLTLTVAYGDENYTYTDVRTYTFNTDWPLYIGATLSDVNNDGYLDLVSEYNTVCFRPNRDAEVFINENTDKNPSPDEALAGDLNGDGTPDNNSSLFYSGIKNTPPATPMNLRVIQGSEGLVLEWDDAIDRETPKIRMRYNVSLKRKGMSGPGSYIISPLNGEVDKAAVNISPEIPYYVESTRMPVALDCFELGKEYEFRVQAIDMWGAVSPFSEVCTFTFEDPSAIYLSAEKICAGDCITAHCEGNGTPVWSAVGGTIDGEGNEVTISWTEGGTKEVSVTVDGKTASRSVYVIPADTTDLSFTLPNMVLGACQVPFTLPEIFRDPSNKVTISTSSPDVVIERDGSSLAARATFPAEEGTYTVTLEYDNGTPCGKRSFSQSVMVNGSNVTPVISIVSVDALTNKTTINWDVPANVLSDPIFNKVILYKEEGSTDNFVKLVELPLTERSFTDPTSDPSVRKSRYRITLGTTYGGESNPSEVHSNVHVMLSKGLNDAINIIWTKYEGALIDQYTIWRGTSPDNMMKLTTVSGYETSYTDFNVPEREDLYYALSYCNTYDTEWIKVPVESPTSSRRNRMNAIAEGFSNYPTTGERIVATLPTSLTILSLEDESILKPEQPELHLQANLLPVTTTIKQVRWSITEGVELATIDNNGTLQYTYSYKDGTVTVLAETMDGSDLNATISISATGFEDLGPVGIGSAPTDVTEIALYPNPTHNYLNISGLKGRGRAVLFSISSRKVLQTQMEGDTCISVANLPKGIYILIVEDEKGRIIAREKIMKI